MFHKHVGHFRVALAVFQLGLPLKAFSDELGIEAMSCKRRAKFDIRVMIDFVIQMGVAERLHRASEAYTVAMSHMGTYKQPSENSSNRKTCQKLECQLYKAEELQERRDWHGWKSLKDWERHILEDFETGKF